VPQPGLSSGQDATTGPRDTGGMPELPDVEGFRRTLDACARGRRIERVDVADAGVLHGVSARRLRERLRGRTVAEPARHGKWLMMPTEDGPAVLLHFGMTGGLLCCRSDEPVHRHDRVVLTFGDDQLRYRDQRKLKGLWFAAEGPGDREAHRLLDDQGPDAAEVSRGTLASLLAARRGGLKSALLDQSVLAGLGNLMADEILWRAGLDPRRRARDLTDGETRVLHAELRRTVRSASRAGRVPPRPSWLTGHRDDPEGECPRCDGPLRSARVAGRTTVWCPHCQPPAS
jgi:formamidopyrimidine-DNA glycosylase